MDKKKTDQPVYKKAWFWVLIVVGAVIILPVIAYISTVSKTAQVLNGAVETVNQQVQQSTPDKTEYNLGETITVDGVDYVVSSVNRNYSTGNMYVKPSDGKEFVKVNISIKNNSDSKKDYNAINWKIEDGNGDITSYSITAQADDSLNSGELAAGGTKQGSIVYEIPVGSSAKMHFQPNLFSNKDIIINL